MYIRNIWLEMKAVLRSARQIINAELAPLHLNGAEGDILFHLLTGSARFTQDELAEQLDIGKAAVSRAVDSLETKGYVARTRLTEDRRAYSVALTEKAHKAGDKVRGVYERLYAQVREGIADEEFTRIEALLSRVAANLQPLEDR